MKILIVDDEDIIREGIVKSILWRENGFDLATPCRNGEEAVQVIGSEHPDIILADINMPFMNGIELASWIQEHHPEMKVLFLTGYDDFQYARQAIELKAAGYVLKYEKHEVLLGELKRISEEIKKERREKKLQEKGKSQLATQLMTDLIIGTAKINSRSEVLETLGFDQGDHTLILTLVSIILHTGLEYDQPNINGLHLFSYINVIGEVCRPFADHVLCNSYDNQIYVLFVRKGTETENADEAVHHAMEESVEKLAQFLNVDGRVGISSVYHDIFKTDAAYNSTYKVLQSISGTDCRRILHVRETESGLASNHAVIREAAHYIKDNYAVAGLSLNDLAEHIHLSPSHLCRIIKKYRNTNFMSWLTMVRIEKAEELMRTTDRKIYEICELVGYNNPQYFSVVFKKYTGLSPQEYKQKLE